MRFAFAVINVLSTSSGTPSGDIVSHTVVATEAVSPHVRLIRGPIGTGFVAIYVVLGRRTALVDTGFAQHPVSTIGPGLATIGLTLREVDLILTTHAHPDHVGGHASVVSASDATVGVHPADQLRMDGLWKRPVPDDDFLADFHAVGLQHRTEERIASLLADAGRPVIVELTLRDGDRIDLGAGVALDVVHTPGHTGGSLTYLIQPDMTALVGDAIQGLGGGSGLPLYEDPEAYLSSLARIGELGVPMVGLGHRFRSRHLVGASPVVEGRSLAALLEESGSFPPIADQVAREVVAARYPSDKGAICAFLQGLPAPFDGHDADLEAIGEASLHAALLHIERARTLL